MLKILHVITGLHVGGAETALLRLLCNEDRARFQSQVFSVIGDGPIGEELRKQGLSPLNCGRGRPDLARSVWSLLRHCRSLRPDVIQGWMYHGNLLASLAARVCGVRRHGWNLRHSVDDLSVEKPTTRLVIRLGAPLSALPRWIIYNSRRSIEQHRVLGYAPAKAVLIPNGFDTRVLRPDPAYRSELRQRFGLDPALPVVGMIARYHPQKDHRCFLDAAARVARQFPEARFVAIGRDVTFDNAELAAQVDALGLRERVRLLGELPHAGRAATLFDVNVLSSAYGEGFPNAVAEGMACGVPSIGTDVGDTAWVIGAGGSVVPPSNSEALGAAVGKLLALSEAERGKLGALARQRIEETFSIQRNVAEYSQLFAG